MQDLFEIHLQSLDNQRPIESMYSLTSEQLSAALRVYSKHTRRLNRNSHDFYYIVVKQSSNKNEKLPF